MKGSTDQYRIILFSRSGFWFRLSPLKDAPFRVCGVKLDGKGVCGWCQCINTSTPFFFFLVLKFFPVSISFLNFKPWADCHRTMFFSFLSKSRSASLYLSWPPCCHVASSWYSVWGSWRGGSKHTHRSWPSWAVFLSADVSIFLPFISDERAVSEFWSHKDLYELEIISLVEWILSA